jgi:hypothetical protein
VQGDVERKTLELLEHLLAGDRKIVPDLGVSVEGAAKSHGVVLKGEGLLFQLIAPAVLFDQCVYGHDAMLAHFSGGC